MKLPSLKDADLEGKRVIIRMDLDVSLEALAKGDIDADIYRLEKGLESLKLITSKAQKTIILGHRGRPDFKGDESEEQVIQKYTLLPLVEYFNDKLKKQISFVPYHYLSRLYDGSLDSEVFEVILVENFRFWSEEEENKDEFAQSFTQVADLYVNEAFSVSHRKHASIVGIPKYIDSVAGIRLVEEVENLSKVFESPKRPVVILISGLKKDKLDYVDKFSSFADKILIGGRLPEYLGGDTESVRKLRSSKIVVANLSQDKEDITVNSIEAFEEEISKAGTIVVSGPLGKFEDEGHLQGTKRVYEAVTRSSAFKVAGGGETQKAIEKLDLSKKFDWISVGGGAMLDFLADGSLPGIEALKKDD
ncbi:phosphoglycerate kinase [Candidatus Woesebacteria bacterium]|nr:phosphoglycerate kinase [Candidatus Woesebacteria bacterium]